MNDFSKYQRYNGSNNVVPKMTVGMLYRYNYKQWVLIPSIGYGVSGITATQLSYTLKEKGTNREYDIEYRWFDKDSGEGYKALDYLCLELKGERKISKSIALTFGASYRHYFDKSNFSARIYNHYDRSLVKEKVEYGNNINTLGVNAGIMF